MNNNDDSSQHEIAVNRLVVTQANTHQRKCYRRRYGVGRNRQQVDVYLFVIYPSLTPYLVRCHHRFPYN